MNRDEYDVTDAGEFTDVFSRDDITSPNFAYYGVRFHIMAWFDRRRV